MVEDCIEKLRRERDGLYKHLHECEQIAGKALGYPWYKDDQKNFPGATEKDGVCIGEHFGDTIVSELATRLQKVERDRDAALARAAEGEKLLRGARAYAHNDCSIGGDILISRIDAHLSGAGPAETCGTCGGKRKIKHVMECGCVSERACPKCGGDR